MPSPTPSILDRLIPTLIAVVAASIFFSLTIPSSRDALPFRRPSTSALPQAVDSLTLPLPTEIHDSESPRSVAPVVIIHGARDLKLIALTFDACSTREPSRYDERITNILLETGTPATFFLGGMWMLDETDHTRQLASHPQLELANHTYHHHHLRNLPDESIREELSRTQVILDSLTGRTARLFRAPFGEYDDRVVRIAAEMGLTTIQYDLASGDPDPTFSKSTLVRYVTSMARNGSIIVMHVNGRGWHTAEALPEIIQTLRRKGYAFVTVSDLIGAASDAAEQSKH